MLTSLAVSWGTTQDCGLYDISITHKRTEKTQEVIKILTVEVLLYYEDSDWCSVMMSGIQNFPAHLLQTHSELRFPLGRLSILTFTFTCT
jgi:hypothetical protein